MGVRGAKPLAEIDLKVSRALCLSSLETICTYFSCNSIGKLLSDINSLTKYIYLLTGCTLHDCLAAAHQSLQLTITPSGYSDQPLHSGNLTPEFTQESDHRRLTHG